MRARDEGGTSLREIWRGLRDGKYANLLQFVKFGLVGVSNTAISYGIEMLCYYLLFKNVPWSESVRIGVTSVAAFLVSVTNSYYWNNRFVFAQGKKSWREHLLSYGKTVLCYGLTGLMLAPALKLWLSALGVPYWLASLGSLIITIPLNFVMNKFWAFRRKTEEGRTDENTPG